MGRVGIQVSPQSISFNGNISGATVSGAFEDGVFDEMANSV
jgi:hypothetical protein